MLVPDERQTHSEADTEREDDPLATPQEPLLSVGVPGGNHRDHHQPDPGTDQPELRSPTGKPQDDQDRGDHRRLEGDSERNVW